MDADDLMHKQRTEIIKYHFIKSNAIAILHKYKVGNLVGKINIENIKLDSKVLSRAHKDKSTIHLRKLPRIHHGHISCIRSVFDKIKQTKRPRGQDAKFVRDLMDNFDQKRIYFINELLSNYREKFSSTKS